MTDTATRSQTRNRPAGTPRSLLDEARDAIVGYRDLEAAIARGKAIVSEAMASLGDHPVRLLRGQVLGLLRSGEELDVAAMVERVVDFERSAGATKKAAEVVEDAVHTFASELEQLAHTGVDSGLAVLRSHLEQLVEHVAAVDETLGTVADAADAITAGRVDEWRQLLAHVETYDRIRDAQQALLKGADVGGRLLVDAGLIRGARSLYPWYLHRDGLPRQGDGFGNAVPTPPAWPSPSDEVTFMANVHPPSWWWPTTDRPAYLRWLCRPGSPAEPWLPETGEIRRHFEAMQHTAPDPNASGLGRDPLDTVSGPPAYGRKSWPRPTQSR